MTSEEIEKAHAALIAMAACAQPTAERELSTDMLERLAKIGELITESARMLLPAVG